MSYDRRSVKPKSRRSIWQASGSFKGKPQKSGVTTTKPVASPYSFPFQFLDETVNAMYPYYKQGLPPEVRKYTDSAYDLRNKGRKYWYDKWGKPHIDKWWESQLEYAKILQTVKKELEKTSGKTNNPYPLSYGQQSSRKYRNRAFRIGMRKYCWVLIECKSNRGRQIKRRSSRKKSRYYGGNTYRSGTRY